MKKARIKTKGGDGSEFYLAVDCRNETSWSRDKTDGAIMLPEKADRSIIEYREYYKGRSVLWNNAFAEVVQ